MLLSTFTQALLIALAVTPFVLYFLGVGGGGFGGVFGPKGGENSRF
jgi:hypothetical protein